MSVFPEWYRSLVEASFRGIPFQVRSYTREGGIRGADHEYPGRDEAAPEDTGNKINRFAFDAYLFGDDYHLRAQDLITALRVGKGLLKHPRWGERSAICRSWSISEIGNGEATFSLAFVEDLAEAGEIFIEPDDAKVDVEAGDLETAALAEFTEDFAIDEQPGAVYERQADDIATRIDDLRTATQSYAPTDPTAFEAALADLDALRSSPYAITASTISAAYVSAIEAIGDLDALLAAARLRRAVLLDEGATVPPNPTEVVIQRNEDAVSALIQRAVLAEALVAAKDRDFVVYDDAIAVRDELDDLVEEEAERPIDRVTWRALTNAGNALHGWLTGFADDLAQIIDYEVTSTTSVLELAWQLYGDAERAEEILERNGIVCGGFVGPGTIRVLSR